MRDEIDGRLWIDHGPQFTAFIKEGVDQVRVAFDRLAAIEYEAPWQREVDDKAGCPTC